MNIIFGTKRLGKVDGSHEAYQKYDNKAVVTLEADRGKGRTRRILFNKTAMEQLNLDKGDVQYISFGTIDSDENGNRAIIIANVDMLVNIDDLTTYKTSKNAVAFEDSKEKGKAISSASLTKDLITFLDLDENEGVEYGLESLDGTDIPCDAFKFVALVPEGPIAVIEEADAGHVMLGLGDSPDQSFLQKTEAEPVTE